jgi:peptidoglycan/LPS O-acetylase OafA/YrhL
VKSESAKLDFRGRIRELDGIRGVAIGMILAHHYFLLLIQAVPGSPLAYLQAAGRLAWTGVDLFFVLSGFLIGGILLDARNSTNYFRVFYTRRFFRIVPIYALSIGGIFSLFVLYKLGFAGRFGWMFQQRLPWISYPFFLQNFWMASRITFGVFGLGVTWSLAIEEQFYLTLPLLMRLLNPRRLVPVLIGGIVAAPILRIALYSLWPNHFYSWFVMMPCRADALLLGVLGAVAVRDANWRTRLENNRAALFTALAILACGFVVLTRRNADPYGFAMLTGGFTWLALFYLCILLCALFYRDGWLGRVLRCGWLVWLGSIAYGAYLLHETVRALLFGLIWGRFPSSLSFPVFCVSVLALAITLIVCRASWVFLETPLMRIGHREKYQFGEKGERSTAVLPVVAGGRESPLAGIS